MMPWDSPGKSKLDNLTLVRMATSKRKPSQGCGERGTLAHNVSLFKMWINLGNSLIVQWLGLSFTAVTWVQSLVGQLRFSQAAHGQKT